MGQPTKFKLGSLLDGRLQVIEGIRVERTDEEGVVLLEAEEINEFGMGDTFPEALRDLQNAIAELYFSLQESRDSLGRHLHGTWDVLQRKIKIRKPESDVTHV